MKIIYKTLWAAKDSNKEYPHGWGFEPFYVEFSQKMDPVECSKICKEKLSNDEFECIGIVPLRLIDGTKLSNKITFLKKRIKKSVYCTCDDPSYNSVGLCINCHKEYRE